MTTVLAPTTVNETTTNSNNNDVNNDDKNNKKKKPRYSKAKKRELQQLKQEEEEVERNAKRTRKRTNPTVAKPDRPKTRSKAKTNQEPKDAIDQILQCAEKSLFTDSIVVENKVDIVAVDVANEPDSASDETNNVENTTTATTEPASASANRTTPDKKLIVEIVSGCDISKQQDESASKPSPETPLPLSPPGNHRLLETTICTVKVQPLLVLDLNGILCHRDRKHKRNEFWEKILQAKAAAATVSATTKNGQPPRRPWRLRPSIGNVANSYIIPRTDLLECLRYLDRHFCLAVWTSSKPKTAKKLLKVLLSTGSSNEGHNRERGGAHARRENYDDDDDVRKGIRSRLLFVWSQTQCIAVTTKDHRNRNNKSSSSNNSDEASTKTNHNATTADIPETTTPEVTDRGGATTSVIGSDATTGMAKGDKNDEGGDGDDDEHSFDGSLVFEKHLPKIWEAYPLWSASNTLLIDDSPEKCPFAMENCIHPPPLHGRIPPPNWRFHCSRLQQEGARPALTSDQENEDLQARFFRALVDFWTHQPHASQPWSTASNGMATPTTQSHCQQQQNENENENENGKEDTSREGGISRTETANTKYYEFLRTHAGGHMGWRNTNQRQGS